MLAATHHALFPPPEVCIVGAGIAGLVAAALLERAGVPFIVLEKRSRAAMTSGADIGLWPGAWAILDGILKNPSQISNSNEIDSYPVRLLRIHRGTRAVYSLNLTDSAVGSPRIISRRHVLERLLQVVPEEKVICEASVLQLTECENHVEIVYTVKSTFATMAAVMVIGADGVGSTCATHVDRQALVNSNGVICHRGLVDLSVAAQTANPTVGAVRSYFIHQERDKSSCLNLQRDSDLDWSYGFVDLKFNLGYWWVKELYDAGPGSLDEVRRRWQERVERYEWPEPLRTLYKITADVNSYIHLTVKAAVYRPGTHTRIAQRLHSKYVVLIGDAAHCNSHTLFQGASTAIEDAYLLTHILCNSPPSTSPETMFQAFNTCQQSVSQPSKVNNKKSLSTIDTLILQTLKHKSRIMPSARLESKLNRLGLCQPLHDEDSNSSLTLSAPTSSSSYCSMYQTDEDTSISFSSCSTVPPSSPSISLHSNSTNASYRRRHYDSGDDNHGHQVDVSTQAIFKPLSWLHKGYPWSKKQPHPLNDVLNSVTESENCMGIQPTSIEQSPLPQKQVKIHTRHRNESCIHPDTSLRDYTNMPSTRIRADGVTRLHLAHTALSTQLHKLVRNLKKPTKHPNSTPSTTSPTSTSKTVHTRIKTNTSRVSSQRLMVDCSEMASFHLNASTLCKENNKQLETGKTNGSTANHNDSGKPQIETAVGDEAWQRPEDCVRDLSTSTRQKYQNNIRRQPLSSVHMGFTRT